MRFDRINSVDVWRDTNAPDSYDKLIEFHGNVRWIILAGSPNSNYLGSYDQQVHVRPVFESRLLFLVRAEREVGKRRSV